MQSNSERRARLGLRLVVGVGILGAVSSFVACLDATQIDGDVNADTTLCAPGTASRARYAIRAKRLDRTDGVENDVRQNDGEFERCDATQASAILGNFTFVPETTEGREGLQLIELVVNTAGNGVETCLSTTPLPLECVVVRRRVRFVAHRAIRLPMYLDDRCRGVSCEQDSTCFRGACKTADVTCDDGSCLIPEERERGSAYDPGKIANLPPGVVGVDDAGQWVFVDGATTPPLPDATLPPLPDGAPNPGDSASFPDVRSDGTVPGADTSTDGTVPPPDASIPDARGDGPVEATNDGAL